MENLKQTILDYVRREYLEDDDDRELNEDTPLISGGIVDSFSMVSLKRFLEKKNGIQIPDCFTAVLLLGSIIERIRVTRPTRLVVSTVHAARQQPGAA